MKNAVANMIASYGIHALFAVNDFRPRYPDSLKRILLNQTKKKMPVDVKKNSLKKRITTLGEK